MRKVISRNIWILAIVSLFTDISSEMLYPITPLYFKSIGLTVVLIGIIEGVAEAISGLSRAYFGELSDRKGVRNPFIKVGYWISAIARPLMGIFAFPVWIFGARSLDLFGKGLRDSPRDALLSDESTPQTKGAVFGFHRMMDTFGAVIGPSIALLYLHFNPGSYRAMFFISFGPSVLAAITVFFLKEKKKQPKKKNKSAFAISSSLRYIKEGPKDYKKLLLGLLLFTLINSSKAFLILKVKDTGQNDLVTIGMYIFYNCIYALFAFPMGKLADKIGLKRIFMVGLALFAIVYACMAFNTSMIIFYILFFLYGLFMASTEGIARAWITNVADKHDTGKALGVYAGLNSLLTLLASTVAGIIWYKFSPQSMFYITTGVAVLIILYFLFVVNNYKGKIEHAHAH